MVDIFLDPDDIEVVADWYTKNKHRLDVEVRGIFLVMLPNGEPVIVEELYDKESN